MSAEKKILVVCYSRTGTAGVAADKLKIKLGCDIDYVTYAGNKKKPGFCKALMEAFGKKTCEITGDAKKPGIYDLVVVVSPVWASALSTPIRTYLKKHGSAIKSYSLLFVLGKNGNPEQDAAAAAGKKPEKTVMLLSSKVKDGTADYGELAASLT